jgi:predicted SpoU family rRNA methylase
MFRMPNENWFIYSLFNDAVNNTVYTVSNYWIVVNNVKEADVAELWVLFQNLFEGIEQNHKNISVNVYWPEKRRKDALD